jgi:ATP-dependent Clp protease ATP-binding subunit ClpB
MTSNLPPSALRTTFRPEFLNRVDETIIFQPLQHEHLRRIVDIQMERLRTRLEARHISIEWTDEARDHLILAGYEPEYGARPLKRAIQREVETRIARMLLEGKLHDGVHLLISAQRGELSIEPRDTTRSAQ